MSEERPKVKPSMEAANANWRNSELPFFERLQLAMKNNFTKLRNRDNCCGNYGEPGC